LSNDGRAISRARRRDVLARALGEDIAHALDDPSVVEVLVNADGRLWVERVGEGMSAVQRTLSSDAREAIIRLLAHEANALVSDQSPALSTKLPSNGARVQALLPPLVEAPVLAIRKRPDAIYRLADYLAQGIATSAQVKTLAEAVARRRNLVVAGGTGSGKTTLLNALLAEPAFAQARVILLEDTAELQCQSPNRVQLLTNPPSIDMRALVQMTMRLRPDRIVVGEVRDGAALEVLKAWNTGHPGGLLTVHANSAADALVRLEDLAGEASVSSTARLVAQAIELVVFMQRTASGREIAEIIDLTR
jgi:P-type conjugative transfer ATPase TrbB